MSWSWLDVAVVVALTVIGFVSVLGLGASMGVDMGRDAQLRRDRACLPGMWMGDLDHASVCVGGEGETWTVPR